VAGFFVHGRIGGRIKIAMRKEILNTAVALVLLWGAYGALLSSPARGSMLAVSLSGTWKTENGVGNVFLMYPSNHPNWYLETEQTYVDPTMGFTTTFTRHSGQGAGLFFDGLTDGVPQPIYTFFRNASTTIPEIGYFNPGIHYYTVGNNEPVTMVVYQPSVNGVDFGGGPKMDHITVTAGTPTPVNQVYGLRSIQIDFYINGAGDFNGDNQVDAADYGVWRKNFGSLYTAKDYVVWRTNLGQTYGTSSAAVPEPSALFLVGVCVCIAKDRRLRKSPGSN
jgi:hypothetical protein